MKYDFTTVLDRRGMDALAVDSLGTSPGFSPGAPKEGFDPIPMWVAQQLYCGTCDSMDMGKPACSPLLMASGRGGDGERLTFSWG